MLLGSLIRHLTDASRATEALLALDDLRLLARVGEAARAEGSAAGDYAAAAVRRFADQAGDEDWLALMNALEGADDPGAACLRTMIGWALRTDQPSCCGHAHG